MSWHEELSKLESECFMDSRPGIKADLEQYAKEHTTYGPFIQYIINMTNLLEEWNALALRHSLLKKQNPFLVVPSFPNSLSKCCKEDAIDKFVKKIYPKLDTGTGIRIQYLTNILNLVTHKYFARAYDYHKNN